MAKQKGPMFWIDLLTMEEIEAIYLHFSGATKVKFKERGEAEQRLLNVTYGKLPAVLRQAFKECGLGEDKINQFGSQLRGPLAFPDGQMKPGDFKQHQKVIKEANKDKVLPDSAVAVLLAIRELNSQQDGAGKLNTTEIAKKLDTSTPAVCKEIERLVKRNLITAEEEHTDDFKFYWVTLTEEGKTADVQMTGAGRKLMPNSSSGPVSDKAGKFIYKLVENNPRREGTNGWKSWNLIVDGMSYESYRNAGGRNVDLQWDIDHNWIELRTTEQGPPEKKPAKGKSEKAAKPKDTPPAEPATPPPAKEEKSSKTKGKKPAAKKPAAKKKGKAKK